MWQLSDPPVALLAAVVASLGAVQPSDVSGLPVVTVTGPTVVAFWEVPSSNSTLIDDPDLASALDEQQYYWAQSRSQLVALGIAARDQPGRHFLVRSGGEEHVFEAPFGSAAVGYLLVDPGRPPVAVYRLQYPDALREIARAFFATGLPE